MIFFPFSDNNKNKEKYLNHSLIDLMILWIYDLSTFSIHRHNFEFSWAVRGENFLYVSRGGEYYSSTSIPMGGLSNRCNWCSIPKRRKRSSESGFLWSDKESNLFKCSRYSIFPWKGRSTYGNCLWYFKEGGSFYGTFL